MNSKMPILLAVVFVSLISWAGDAGTPPQPAGDKARFQLVSGFVQSTSGKDVPVTIRIDTFTGGTWTLSNVGGGQTWLAIHEVDSEVVQTLIRQITEKKQ